VEFHRWFDTKGSDEKLLITGALALSAATLSKYLLKRYRIMCDRSGRLTYLAPDNFPRHCGLTRIPSAMANIRNSNLVEELIAEAISWCILQLRPMCLAHCTILVVFEQTSLARECWWVRLKAPVRALHPYLYLRGLWLSSIVPMTEGSSTQSHHPMRAGKRARIGGVLLRGHLLASCPHLRPSIRTVRTTSREVSPAHHQRANDESLIIHGDGTHSVTGCMSRTFCKAIDRAIHADLSPSRRAINLETGVETPILAIADLILDLLGKPRSFSGSRRTAQAKYYATLPLQRGRSMCSVGRLRPRSMRGCHNHPVVRRPSRVVAATDLNRSVTVTDAKGVIHILRASRTAHLLLGKEVHAHGANPRRVARHLLVLWYFSSPW